MNDQPEHHEHPPEVGPIAVAVITPSGTYPSEDEYHRSYEGEIVDHVLEAAKVHLHLTDTSDWVAYVENRPIEPAKTFAENDLRGIVEIEWHKHEGGGGA